MFIFTIYMYRKRIHKPISGDTVRRFQICLIQKSIFSSVFIHVKGTFIQLLYSRHIGIYTCQVNIRLHLTPTVLVQWLGIHQVLNIYLPGFHIFEHHLLKTIGIYTKLLYCVYPISIQSSPTTSTQLGTHVHDVTQMRAIYCLVKCMTRTEISAHTAETIFV